MRSKMPSKAETAEKKRQKKLHIEKLKTLQKMCGEALKDYESLRKRFEKNGSDVDHSLLQSKIHVVKRLFREMQEVSKSIGKAGYLVGNFYMRKHSMQEINDTKGLQRYYIAEIPEHRLKEFCPKNNFCGGALYSDDVLSNPFMSGVCNNPQPPHQHDITALDDYENNSEEEPPPESPFDNLEKLMKQPAHLSVLMHYLISNSNPSALFLFLITSNLKQMPKSQGMFQFLCSVYCTFLQDGATMKVNVSKQVVGDVKKVVECDAKNSGMHKDVLRLLARLREDCLPLVQNLLDDFKYKRLLGLGSFFGDQDLHNDMSSNARSLVIERSLWPHFEQFVKDSWNSYSLCLASCLATFFKMAGFSPALPHASKVLNKCPIYRQKNKNSFVSNTFPTQISKEKTQLIREHYFVVLSYIGGDICSHCSRMVCSAGDYGYKCTECYKHFHRSCVKAMDSKCDVIKRDRDPHKFKCEIVRFSSQVMGRDALNNNQLRLKSNEKMKTIQHFVNHPQQPNPSHPPRDGDASTIGGETGSPVYSLNIPLFQDSFASLSATPQPYPVADLVEGLSLRDILKFDSTVDKKEYKKNAAIEEFVTSENIYLRFLKVLHNVHYVPMLKRFPRDFVVLLFPNLPEVITIHDNLQKDFKALRKEKNVDHLERIAQILLKHFSGEQGSVCKEVFAKFIEKQPYTIKVLKSKQAEVMELNSFIQERMNHPLCDRLSLQDLLLKVMQRISKYPMLVRNLIKLTPDSKPRVLDTLENVLWNVEKITSYVNKIVCDFEMKFKLHVLQRKLVITAVEKAQANTLPYYNIYKSLNLKNHKLIFDGPLKWKVNGTYTIPMHVVLLEDMLILLQKQHQQLGGQLFETITRSLNQKINSRSLILAYHSTLIAEGKEDTRTTHSPIIQFSDIIVKPAASDNKAFFLISTSSHGPQIYFLVAESSQEKKQWINYVSTASQAYKDKKYKASFYYGIESKRLKNVQMQANVQPASESSDVCTVSNLPNTQGHEPSGKPSELSEWGSIINLEAMMNRSAAAQDPPDTLRADKSDDFEGSDDVFATQKRRCKSFAKSVDDLSVADPKKSSSGSIYSMYLEFNKFVEALGDFLAEDGGSSSTASFSPKQLREWSNDLHSKFKLILDDINEHKSVNKHPFKRSFSDEDRL